ncbi:MAG: hypothetical protein ABSH53_15925 [Holophaga sp.]
MESPRGLLAQEIQLSCLNLNDCFGIGLGSANNFMLPRFKLTFKKAFWDCSPLFKTIDQYKYLRFWVKRAFSINIENSLFIAWTKFLGCLILFLATPCQ